MKPTQAQIEAAAKAMRDLPVTPWNWDAMAMAALTAAAEAGRPTQTNKEIAREFCRKSVQQSFGLSDERTGEYAKVIAELLDYGCAATIERCAQVADRYIGTYGGALEIAAAIRALKEKP